MLTVDTKFLGQNQRTLFLTTEAVLGYEVHLLQLPMPQKAHGGLWWLFVHLVGCCTREDHWTWGIYCLYSKAETSQLFGQKHCFISQGYSLQIEAWEKAQERGVHALHFLASLCRDTQGLWWLLLLPVTTDKVCTGLLVISFFPFAIFNFFMIS